MRNTLDRKLAFAAAWDTGNRSKRKAGRQAWSREDYDAACDELYRLLDLLDDTATDEVSRA